MRDLFGEPGVLANGVDIAGVDEVGRGPLAGPVVAGAVILDPARRIKGLKDSKELDPDERGELAALIRERAISWALGRAEVAEIDRINILRATLVAMRRAVGALAADVRVAYIDGNMAPLLPDCAAVTVVGGDATVPAISAASIIAKVARDEEMVAASAHYPGYGFECHKGYATASHLAALRDLGPTPLHRRSFAPVEQAHARQTLLFAAVTPS